MLTISKPLSAGQAAAYHAREFTSTEQSYYTQSGQVRGEWQGQLAAAWGLTGEVTAEQFSRLAQGQHPETGEQLVRYQQAREYVNDAGETVRTLEHRAGWDATFSAPKSVSLTALVGGDERVREAHRESVRVAVDEIEKYVEARIGGNAPAQTTGKWAAAKFEHDSSRPVDGYAAPQLHTHVVFFNLTETADGKAHAAQPQELYRSQQYGTAVYQSELAWRLEALGYEIEQCKNGAPEIKGYSKEYLEASSPRSQQIREHMAEQGVNGAGAAQIAAHRTRDAKQALSQEETLKRHREMAEAFGKQPERVTQAKEKMHVINHEHDARLKPAQSAVTFARDRNLQRDAVVDERALMRDALKRSMGQATFAEVREHFEERIGRGDFLEVPSRGPARTFTTGEMIGLERKNIERMQAGQGKYGPLVAQHIHFEHLHEGQRQAVETILANRDQITGLQGVAGAGKTTSLAAIREAAEKEGYRVEGFAPTSRAAHQLEEAGILSATLQHHLAKGERAQDGARHLYFVDESSLTADAGERNLLTVERAGSEKLTYDPRRLQGVTVYRESEREFAEGDRVQFTAPDKERHIANRELGTIESIDESGNMAIKLDSGREVKLSAEEHPHLDYGYAVTSHSSQGATADRVLIHVDSEQAGEQLVNSRLAYVAVSRARYDAQIFTNDAGTLGKALSREVSHAAAVGAGDSGPGMEQDHAQQSSQDHGQAMAMEH